METDSANPPGPEPDEARPRRSIVAKLSLFVGFLVALTAGTLITVGYLYVGDLVGEQIDARLSIIADDRQAQILMAMKEAEGWVRMAATRSRLRSLLDQRRRGEVDADRFRSEIQSVVGDIFEGSDEFLAVRLEDNQGETLAESGEQEALEAFPPGVRGREPSSAGDDLLATSPRSVGSTQAALFGADVHDRDGNRTGWLFTVVDLGRITREASDAQWLGETGELLIGVREGDGVRLLFPPRHEPERRWFPQEVLPAMMTATQGGRGLTRVVDRMDNEALEAYRPVGYGDWGMVVKIDVAEAYAPVARLRRLMAAIGGAILAAGLGSSYLLARRHTRPLRRLAAAARDVAAGDLSAPIAVDSNDEVGALGRAFSRMTGELARSRAELERRSAEELAKSETALREQSEILRSVLDCMTEGVVAADVDLRLLMLNPAAERLMGRRSIESGPGNWSPTVPVFSSNGGEPIRLEQLPLYRAIHGETVDQDEIMVGHASPHRGTCLLVNGRPLVDERGTVRGGLVVLHDITQRKRFELRLAVESETARALAEAGSLADAAPGLLRILVERLGWDLGALWRVDSASGRVQCLALHPKADGTAAELDERLRTIGLQPGEGLAGRAWADRAAVWVDNLSQEPECSLNRLLIDRGQRVGLAVPFPPRGDCLGVLALFGREPRDADPGLIDMLTTLGGRIGQSIDRIQMRARVTQSEKLASLGMLSASVAHEINNPLAYVAGNLAALDRDARSLLDIIAGYERGLNLIAASQPGLAAEIRDMGEECDLTYIKEHLRNMLDSTRKGVQRVADIVHNLRGFTRFDRAAAGRIELREAVDEALEMVRGRLERARIVVEQHWEKLPSVPASSAQLNQVFLNLLVNAKQAIAATNRQDGKITISACLRGENICVEVRDNGCGMSPEALSQVFDPFFTTKPPGEGTGLGLAISHGIVIDHGGRIEVESQLGEGSCFRVILPAAPKAGNAS